MVPPLTMAESPAEVRRKQRNATILCELPLSLARRVAPRWSAVVVSAVALRAASPYAHTTARCITATHAGLSYLLDAIQRHVISQTTVELWLKYFGNDYVAFTRTISLVRSATSVCHTASVCLCVCLCLSVCMLPPVPLIASYTTKKSSSRAGRLAAL